MPFEAISKNSTQMFTMFYMLNRTIVDKRIIVHSKRSTQILFVKFYLQIYR